MLSSLNVNSGDEIKLNQTVEINEKEDIIFKTSNGEKDSIYLGDLIKKRIPNNKSSSLSGGAIAAIVIGSVVVVGAAILAAILCTSKKTTTTIYSHTDSSAANFYGTKIE